MNMGWAVISGGKRFGWYAKWKDARWRQLLCARLGTPTRIVPWFDGDKDHRLL